MNATQTPGETAYRWHVQSLAAERGSIDQAVERYLNGLEQAGWAIVTIAPRQGTVLIVARKPRTQEDPHA